VDAALDELADTAWDTLGDEELLTAARDIERWTRRLYGVTLAVTAKLDARGVASARGATSTAVLLRQTLRISLGQARRRIADARLVCPGVRVTGEVIEPVLPVAGASLAAGQIGEEHLGVVRQTIQNLPPDVADEVRGEVEARLVAEAVRFDPGVLVKVAQRIRAHLTRTAVGWMSGRRWRGGS
jgi:hypothetical protein